NSEGSEAEAESGDGDPGDGDPGDGDPGDGDPGDGDGDPTGEETCGDGILDSGEECDGTELGDVDCAALGFVKGELTCSAECSFATAACHEAVCGDGVIEGNEECDGQELGGADCASLGFGDGKPSCTNGCEFDTSVCPSPGEGADCGVFTECPYENLKCVSGTCYDGSEGDPCDWNTDCQNGLTCQGPIWDNYCMPA